MKTPAIACLMLWLLAGCLRATPSHWQGGFPDPDATGPSLAANEDWLVLDSGGSGGMFGKGDIRQKLRDVAFWTDGRHGLACGVAGAFRTVDGGLTWQRVRFNPEAQGGGIHYACGVSGPKEYWVAVGKHPAQGRNLWHSTDAGETWEDAATRFPGKFESIWDLLVRGRHVWLLGGWAPKASYRSNDSGATWTRLELPEGFEPYRAVTPANEPQDDLKTVYLLGAVRVDRRRLPRLLRSDDAGETWQPVALPEDMAETWAFNHATIAFADRERGWLGLDAAGLTSVAHGHLTTDPGATTAILVTADGGRTWQRRSLPPNERIVTDLCLLPNGHGYATVWNGFVAQKGGPRNGTAMYRSLDDGVTWEIVLRGAREFAAIFALDDQRVWAVGDVIGFTANDAIAIRQTTP